MNKISKALLAVMIILSILFVCGCIHCGVERTKLESINKQLDVRDSIYRANKENFNVRSMRATSTSD